MSAREPADRDGNDGQDETFLSRWSRRKARARTEPVPVEPEPVDPGAVKPMPAPAASPIEQPGVDAAFAAQAGPAPPAIELPDLDLLGEDSDYSAFLTPGVDADLRKRALRKLFSSPKFNVFDGLDTYRDDYTSFPALGSIVTADMRYHVERLAKKAVELLDEQTAPAAPTGPVAPAAVVATAEATAAAEPPAPASREAASEASAPDEPSAPTPEENHDRIA